MSKLSEVVQVSVVAMDGLAAAADEAAASIMNLIWTVAAVEMRRGRWDFSPTMREIDAWWPV